MSGRSAAATQQALPAALLLEAVGVSVVRQATGTTWGITSDRTIVIDSRVGPEAALQALHEALTAIVEGYQAAGRFPGVEVLTRPRLVHSADSVEHRAPAQQPLLRAVHGQ